jgi:hypothetical protein
MKFEEFFNSNIELNGFHKKRWVKLHFTIMTLTTSSSENWTQEREREREREKNGMEWNENKKK